MAGNSKWFSEMALKVESFYIQNSGKIDRVSTIGRIWGTRVEDLKSPVGVAGRVLRTIPQVVGLARSFSMEPNTVYARAILCEELPHLLIGEEQSSDHDPTGENLNTNHLAGLLRGIASVLNLKVEEVPLFHETNGTVDIAALKLHLGEGIVMGHLLRGSKDYSALYSPLFSSHSTEETRARLNALWADRGIVGLEIRSAPEEGEIRSYSVDFSQCEITRIEEGEDLVVGSEFANDYRQIADRVKRFEAAGYKRNLMLLGPPGCGKTSIAQKIARQIGRFTINVESGLLASAVLIQVLTYFFHDVILICDDFDRYRGDTQALLGSLERTGSSLIVTCNTVYGFDKAAVRVGRIDEIIDVPKPDLEMRRRLFLHFHGKSAATPLPAPEELDAILKHTDGFTPAEMREVVKCYEVLGYEDSKLEIKRLKRQSKLAESLWFKLDWTGTGNSNEKGAPAAASRSDQRLVESRPVAHETVEDSCEEEDEDDEW